MQNTNSQPLYANNHISIDTVMFGFDGQQLCVLLIPQKINLGDGNIIVNKKLPGNLIYQDENFEEAAHRILEELTGIHSTSLYQYKTYGSKNRASREDILWLDETLHVEVQRIVTTAYVAVVKLDATLLRLAAKHQVEWIPIDKVGHLAFDHNILIEDALAYFRRLVHYNPLIMFELLPRKFTILQFRTLYELISQKKMDIRNFQKKLRLLTYVIPLDEFEEGVRHRAARYYRFDKVAYNKVRR